ncbi:Rv0361 family membrane protein [Corynebacterium freneyi]|uniref:Rv0361 family membrane protein n=1 Tax=Corynebacterium freneyi TaxID=134034 RepID=UPI001CC983BA|nr:hypothetical protein [Corynebacterium freneyi]UBI01411.1 hypothetical protein LA334_07635 [Corynebacterium freneyi]
MNNSGFGQGGPYGQGGSFGQSGPYGQPGGGQSGQPGGGGQNPYGFGVGGQGNQGGGAGNGGQSWGGGRSPQWDQGMQSGFGAGGGYGAPQGAAGGTPGGSGSGSSGSKTPWILGGVGAVALIAIIGVVAFFFLGGSERAEKKAVAEAANDSANTILESDNLVEWNALMCTAYRADDENIQKFQDSFGAFGDEFIASELEAESYEPDDVTFTNDDRTAAEIGSGSSALKMAKEDGEWKICDPDIDFSAFDDFGDMSDIFDDFGDFSDMFDDFSSILDDYDVW